MPRRRATRSVVHGQSLAASVRALVRMGARWLSGRLLCVAVDATVSRVEAPVRLPEGAARWAALNRSERRPVVVDTVRAPSR